MRRICATVAVLAFCAGLAVVGVGLAGAKSKKANSNASINVGFESGTGVPFFEGGVSSGKKGCVGGRKVTVLFARNRDKTAFFAGATTDSSGYFRVEMHSGMRIGGYFARVKKTSKCKFDDSGEVAFSNNNTTLSRALSWVRHHR
jgi:hypothetical protein